VRSVDERCAAVRSRAKRLRRRRNDRVLAALVCLMVLPLIDLTGRAVAGGSQTPLPFADGLFGASSLFGPSVGGYVLVAVVDAVAVATVTVLLMLRRKSGTTRNEDTLDSTLDSKQEGSEPWQK